MDEKQYIQVKTPDNNPVRITFFSEHQKDVSAKIKVNFISEMDIDIEVPDAESIFEIETIIDRIDIFLPGEGYCTTSGVIKYVSGNNCNIKFHRLDLNNRAKIDRYIQQRLHIDNIHRKTYKSVSEIENSLSLKLQDKKGEGREKNINVEKEEKIKILIIDDSIAIHEKFKQIFTEKKFYVLHAMDGMEGIKKSLEELPDLILMDINMPRLNGIESTRIIYSNPNTCHIPICMLTTESEKASVVKAVQVGAKDYIIKTMDAELVLESIRRILEGN